MSVTTIAVKEFKVTGGFVEFQRTMTPQGKFKKGGVLFYKVQLWNKNPGVVKGLIGAPKPVVKTRDVVVIEYCHFRWGDYGPSHSLDWDKISTCSRELSPLHTDEDEIHHGHPPVEKIKVKGHTHATGTLINGIVVHADDNGTDSVVEITLLDKSDQPKGPPVRTERVMDIEKPEYNFGFDLGRVKKSDKIKFLVFHDDEYMGETQIGLAFLPGSAVVIGNKDPITVELTRPPEFRLKKAPASYGQLVVKFDAKFVPVI
jgi:hypothetical protein